ncbi:hypothetical protein F0A16_10665 [Salinicola corii]|uniref:Type I restriction modification DNA specificity domain-containing protein n=1 Tax=Salinicola corii TaxID=2606937 RepID=A0A640WDW9_9GAMM|nr:restriction endonuclease subunit S [Salinicola corii]KAA0018182.1 hypothetical protein F0A16_10665 [Salinicola corii]
MTNLSGTNSNRREATGPKGEGRDSPSTFSAYPEYKDSGVEWLDEVPAHWDIKPLKYVATFNDEVLSESTPDEYLIKYVEISDVDEQLGITGWSEHSFLSAPSRARRILKDGDVLISTVRTYLRAIAPVKEPPENLVGSTGFAAIRPVSDVYHSELLGYTLRAEWFISNIIARSVGVSYPAINASDLVVLPVPVPLWEEQKKIASFLNHETARIDALIDEQKRLIELLKEKRQAVISHAVAKGLDPDVPMKDSGVEWLGEVPAHWRVKRIKHVVCSFEQGWSPQCENVPVGSKKEWGVLKVGCVNHGRFDCQENKKLPDNLSPRHDLTVKTDDVLISRANTRELVGSCAVPTIDYPNLMLSDKLFRLRLHKSVADPLFLAFFMGASQTRKQIELEATGASSSMLNIGQGTVLEMTLPCPPVEEQIEIRDEIVKKTWSLLDMVGEAIELEERLKERRSALISAAVTGKIDVRNWQPEQSIEQPELPMVAEAHATYS